MKKHLILSTGLLWVLLFAASAAAQGTSTNTTYSSGTATNMVIDFQSTSTESSLMPGDSGILNLVLANSGGHQADNVNVYLTSTSAVRTDKTAYLGSMASGQSKTIPVIFTIPEGAKSGLTAIHVKISFDGYKSDGTVDNNQITSWDVPITILSNPIFQMSSNKTSYYRDTVDELNLQIVSKDPVKDVEATLSSNCTAVVGQSKKYLGSIPAQQPFELAYTIKPSSSGVCPASIYLTYTDVSGSKASANLTVGLNVEDAGVDIKIAKVTYSPTAPGQQSNLTVVLRNVGNADANKVTLRLNLTDPFVPVDTAEVYMPQILAGQEESANFTVWISWDADTVAESIPAEITYKVGGTSYTVDKEIGVDITGEVVLKVIAVESSGTSVRVDVANLGSRTANGVQATLITQTAAKTQQPPGNAQTHNTSQQQATTQRIVSYKSDIKANKQSSFTFDTTAKDTAILEIEYTGPNNRRIASNQTLTLSGQTAQAGTGTTTAGTGYGTYLAAAAVLAITYFAYKKIKANQKKI